MVVKEGDSAGNGGDSSEGKAEIGVRGVGLGGEWYRSGSRKPSQESSHLGCVLGTDSRSAQRKANPGIKIFNP